jgi:hypothetical protein
MLGNGYISLRRTSSRHVVVRKSHIRTVGLQEQELGFNQSVKHCPTQRPLNPTETLHLLSRERHTGHLEKLGADTGERVWHGSHRFGSQLNVQRRINRSSNETLLSPPESTARGPSLRKNRAGNRTVSDGSASVIGAVGYCRLD